MDINPVALAAIRQLAGHSQASLSRESSVSQGHISDLESGTKKNASPATIKKLAEALGVPMGAIAAVRVSPKLEAEAAAS